MFKHFFPRLFFRIAGSAPPPEFPPTNHLKHRTGLIYIHRQGRTTGELLSPKIDLGSGSETFSRRRTVLGAESWHICRLIMSTRSLELTRGPPTSLLKPPRCRRFHRMMTLTSSKIHARLNQVPSQTLWPAARRVSSRPCYGSCWDRFKSPRQLPHQGPELTHRAAGQRLWDGSWFRRVEDTIDSGAAETSSDEKIRHLEREVAQRYSQRQYQ